MAEIKNSIKGLEDKVKQLSQKGQNDKDVENRRQHFKKSESQLCRSNIGIMSSRKRGWRKWEGGNSTTVIQKNITEQKIFSFWCPPTWVKADSKQGISV